MQDSELVLVWAPPAESQSEISEVLTSHGLTVRECSSAGELAEGLDGAGCALVTQEVLMGEGLASIENWLRTQPAWSDFPFILLASPADAADGASFAWRCLGNVTVLERPTQRRTLESAVDAALRARRRQYEVRQAIQQRDQFLAMLGHELRNPLAAIALAVESDNDNQATRKQRDIIARQTRHLCRLVDDLLDVARLTNGKIVLNKVTLDVNELAQRCVHGAELSARARSIQIATHFGPGPLLVHADSVRLEEVIGNLLLNAIKFSPPRSHIDVSTRAEHGACVVDVKDTGIGISPSMLPRVFDLFSQADVPLDRAQGGLGIGLTIVKWLVELHGGTVSARSEGLGRGSLFSISLPLIESASRELPPVSREYAPVAPALPVVVVEDNADLLEMTRDLLQSFGCQVETANDGLSGLELLDTFRPALAFIDIGLPGLDGYSLASEVRASQKPQPWLVALTGYGQPEDRQRALAAGFDQHLTKPVSIAALRNAVEVANQTRALREPWPSSSRRRAH